MPEDPHLIRRVVVEGFVQGVGYRDFTRRAARRHGVSGWVRNRADGSVEALIAGPPDAIERILSDMRRGPPGAAVSSLSLVDPASEAAPSGTGFVILPTA